jgi:hypothetical protein
VVVAALVAPALAADEEWPEPLEGPPRIELERPVARKRQWGLGPFEVRDPSVLGQLRAAPMARSPRTLEPGQVELGIRQTQESTYAWGDADRDSGGERVHRLTIDGETRDTDLVARVGVLPRFELGAELDVAHYQGGGFLDGLITSFHKTVGLGTLRRDHVPAHSWIVHGREPNGNEFQLKGRGLGLGDAYLTGRYQLTEGDDSVPAATIGLSLWLPTSSPRFQHARGLAETLSLDLSKRIGDLPVVLYFGGAVTHYDQADVARLHMTHDRLMAYFGAEWELHPRISLVAHAWQESKRETRLYARTNSVKAQNEVEYIAVGVKVVPVQGMTLEVGALESFDKSVGGDFGILANVWVTLGKGEFGDAKQE